jgi:hypothetical protein
VRVWSQKFWALDGVGHSDGRETGRVHAVELFGWRGIAGD